MGIVCGIDDIEETLVCSKSGLCTVENYFKRPVYRIKSMSIKHCHSKTTSKQIK